MSPRIRSLLWIALFGALTAGGAFIRVPIPPVPVTLQTLFVYLAGDLLGSKRGSASQLLYLTTGLMGVPVFAAGGGLGYVLQPTFGYLLGCPVAAWLIGRFVEKRDDAGGRHGFFLANLTGLLVILTMGVVYLYGVLNWVVGQTISWPQAVVSGVLILLPGEIVKAILAAGLARRLKPVIVRTRGG